MNTLVTGGNGFLGLYIAEKLLERFGRVRVLCRQSAPELERPGVELVQGDLRDAATVARACEGIEAVYHVAGVAGIWGPWEHYYRINTLGTQHVVAACRKYHVPKLIYTSSPSVTFDGSDQRNVDASAPYPRHWLCHYSHTKALAEQLVLSANGADGLSTCALRPHLIWGPRDRHLIPRLLARARQGRLLQVGDGRNLVDMIYVENAADAHLQAAERLAPGSPVAGKAYFISQGTPVRCWGWINEILQLAGLGPVRKRIPYPAAYAIGGILEGWYAALGRQTEPPMTRFLAAQLAKDHYFSLAAAERDFGYKAVLPTDEGMARLAAWLRKR